MDITQISVDIDLSARSRSTQEGTSGTQDIGVRIARILDADIAYCFKVTAAANGNIATLTQSTGNVAQTTGVPVITDGDGKDWEGNVLDLDTASAILAVLVVANDANVGTVTLAASDGAESPAGILKAGGAILLLQPNATAVGAASTLAATLSALGDSVKTWVYSRAAA